MIVQCDFDGTITTENVSRLLRENFANGEWRRIQSEYFSGRLGVEESNRQQYPFIKEPREKLEAFVRENIEVRAGFLKFVDCCLAAGIGFVIVSSGLDFYIEAVLSREGISNLELHCARASFGKDGILVSYIGPDGRVVEDGFKKKYLASLKQRGGHVIYIGDGLSDLEAASAADRVFAIGHLHTLLTAKSVAHHTFSDFNDILRQMAI